jgi:membrane protein DedA with SNARE-associated domain
MQVGMMISQVFAAVTEWIVGAISAFGYLAVFVLMAVESACIPLPSEIIMPFAGYLAFKGDSA